LITTSIFDYPVIAFRCEDSQLYDRQDLKDKINDILDSDIVKQNCLPTTHFRGACETTVLLVDTIKVETFDEAIPLVNWVKERILECRTALDSSKKDVLLCQTFINRYHKGFEGASHDHHGMDGVAIFYLEADEKGSDLVFLKESGPWRFPKEVADTDKLHFKVRSGDLIVHHPNHWHAISEHRSDHARVCIIFDFQYI
jgi:hypothetical protein